MRCATTWTICGEVAEHPMVGLPLDSALRGWIDKHLGPHSPVPRYRTLAHHIQLAAG